MQTNYTFGELLKQFRGRMGLSQAELGNQIAVHRNSISNWESGEWPPDMPEKVERLAETLSLSAEETDQLLMAAHYPPKYSPLPPIPAALKFAKFVELFELERSVTPQIELPLSAKARTLIEALDFVGVKWSNFFGFTVGLVRTDTLTETEIEQHSKQFIKFNDWLYWRRKELDVSFLAWAIAFTLGGVLCFVYEKGCSKTTIDFIGQQRKESPAYRQGGTSLGWGIQTSATTFSWVVDLAAKRVYRHTGKHPDKLSYHTRQMLREMDALEAMIQEILAI